MGRLYKAILGGEPTLALRFDLLLCLAYDYYD